MTKLAAKRKWLFADYYDKWIQTYKEGVVASATYTKYLMTAKWIRTLTGEMKMEQLDRSEMQKLVNRYAQTHEKVTTQDFVTQIRAAITDAIDEGILTRNPMIRIVIKGKEPTRKKHKKYLECDELDKLIKVLDLSGNDPTWDKFIFLLAKTGLRFAEALALTPADFDLDKLTLTVNKTWDHKSSHGGFKPTKTPSSMRTIAIDYKTARMIDRIIDQFPEDEPIFVHGKRVFDSTVNTHLKRLCDKAGITVITCHGLRHTQASVLIANSIPIMVVSKRLGHANVSTTQETYAHLLKDTEHKADDKISMIMASLG